MKSAGNREPIKMTPQRTSKYNPDKGKDISSPAGIQQGKKHREKEEKRERY